MLLRPCAFAFALAPLRFCAFALLRDTCLSMPTSKDLQHLLDRIQLRLDESFVGIGSEVADLLPEDLAELLNQLRINEAAAIVSMLPLQRCIELCDQPTMRRRAAILEQLEPSRVAAILEGL